MELLYKDESYAVIGACFEVYNDKGNGFLEDVYQESLELELGDRGIPFLAKPPLTISYKKRILRKHYEPDLTCYDKIIIKLKAVKELNNEHRAQIQNYLKATGYKLGLLVNFGKTGELQYERIIN